MQKFKIQESYRLVTTFNNGIRHLCFLGNHDETEKYLDRSRKTKLYVDEDNRLTSLKKINSVKDYVADPFPKSDLYNTRLINRINDEDLNYLFSGIPARTMSLIGLLDTSSSNETIWEIISPIENNPKSNVIFDVLWDLRSGDLDSVKKRILLEKGHLKSLDSKEFLEIKSGKDVVVLEVGSKEYSAWIQKFKDTSGFFDWMLFTHPKQQAIIDEDFKGPALLNGVSGSGKTCIIVKRAIRLASKKPENTILILTLNRSLSNLIGELIDHAPRSSEKIYRSNFLF